MDKVVRNEFVCTRVFVYIQVCVCVCVCAWAVGFREFSGDQDHSLAAQDLLCGFGKWLTFSGLEKGIHPRVFLCVARPHLRAGEQPSLPALSSSYQEGPSVLLALSSLDSNPSAEMNQPGCWPPPVPSSLKSQTGSSLCLTVPKSSRKFAPLLPFFPFLSTSKALSVP